MSLSKEEIFKAAYDAGLITLGAVSVGFASKKIAKDDLGVPTKPMSLVKLAAAIAGGSLIVKYLQKKEFVPVDPFKKKTTST